MTDQHDHKETIHQIRGLLNRIILTRDLANSAVENDDRDKAISYLADMQVVCFELTEALKALD